MASSVTLGPAWAMDGPVTDASLVRALGNAALVYQAGGLSAMSPLAGVFPGPSAMQVTAPGGMTVSVSSGPCAVAAPLVANGMYYTAALASANLTVATADPTNPRIDLVCVTIIENGDNTSTSEVQIIAGTPAGSPVPPSVPNYSIPLAKVAVAAGSTSIVTGNITDLRTMTVAPGGIMPVQNLSSLPAGYPGAYVHDPVTGRLAHNSGSGTKQPVVLPYPPQLAVATTAPAASTGSQVTVLTLPFTADGNTDFKVDWGWPGAYQASPNGTPQCKFRLSLDGSTIDRCCFDVSAAAAAFNPSGGGSKVTYLTTALGTRPGAGSHTMLWTYQLVGSTHALTLDVHTDGPLTLRVQPVPL